MNRINGTDRYIYEEIVPRYADFDAAHKEDHALTVINQSMKLLDEMGPWLSSQEKPDPQWQVSVDREVLKMAAACHDLGLVNGRDRHLQQWFSPEEIELIAQAAEDHRASGKAEPRSIYGKIVAEADRVIEAETIIRRTIQFGHKHYPDLSREEHMERAVAHLKEKYGRGGYLKLWIPWSDNAARLNALQDTIADDDAIHAEVARIMEYLK